MNKNKSIDGLSLRAPKKSTTSAHKPSALKSKTAIKNPHTSVKSQSKPKKITIAEPSSSPTEATPKSNPVEDFLKPVQAFSFDEATGELKAADPKAPKTTQPKPKKIKKPMSKKRKIILTIITIIVLAILGLAIGFIIWGNDIISKITGGQSGVLDLIGLIEENYEPLKTDPNGRTNILAFGTSGYNMDGKEGDGVHDGAALTDSIMIISLDQETGDTIMLSLPRDLKASPTCTATSKINEVYWCNNMYDDNEQAGAEALMTEVGSILGIDFQYYVHVNWGSLVQIVDILGGITVTLDEDIEDYYWTEAVYEAGVAYTLNGEEALGLARARHGTANGDFSRGASQQKILIGIKDKIREKNLSLTDGINLANTLGDNLRTNFSIDEIKTFSHLASNFDFNNIRQISLLEPERLMTTSNINGISYVIPSAGIGNYGSIQEYIEKTFSNNPRAYEDYTILILNGTETPGLASAEQSTLQEDGYYNITIDDAPDGEYREPYTLYYTTDTAPGTQKLLEEKYHTPAQPISDAETNLPTNYTFILVLGNSPTLLQPY